MGAKRTECVRTMRPAHMLLEQVTYLQHLPEPTTRQLLCTTPQARHAAGTSTAPSFPLLPLRWHPRTGTGDLVAFSPAGAVSLVRSLSLLQSLLLFLYSLTAYLSVFLSVVFCLSLFHFLVRIFPFSSSLSFDVSRILYLFLFGCLSLSFSLSTSLSLVCFF